MGEREQVIVKFGGVEVRGMEGESFEVMFFFTGNVFFSKLKPMKPFFFSTF